MNRTLHNVTGIREDGRPVSTQAWDTTLDEAVAILTTWHLDDNDERPLVAGYIAEPETGWLYHYTTDGDDVIKVEQTRFEARR